VPFLAYLPHDYEDFGFSLQSLTTYMYLSHVQLSYWEWAVEGFATTIAEFTASAIAIDSVSCHSARQDSCDQGKSKVQRFLTFGG
jgi:hypothetical protein